jgi:hypothetical protein
MLLDADFKNLLSIYFLNETLGIFSICTRLYMTWLIFRPSTLVILQNLLQNRIFLHRHQNSLLYIYFSRTHHALSPSFIPTTTCGAHSSFSPFPFTLPTAPSQLHPPISLPSRRLLRRRHSSHLHTPLPPPARPASVLSQARPTSQFLPCWRGGRPAPAHSSELPRGPLTSFLGRHGLSRCYDVDSGRVGARISAW